VVLHARASLSKPNRGTRPFGAPHYGTAFGLFDSAAFPRVLKNRIEAAKSVASKLERKLK
jgi:hypothetical protein